MRLRQPSFREAEKSHNLIKMKRRTLLILIISCALSFNLSAQKTINGWCHLLPNAKTRLLVNYINTDHDVYYNSDEILLVFETNGAKAYAIDIDGRIVEVQDTATLKKIEIQGRVVKITKQVNISLQKKLHPDDNVWLVGFNSVNNAAKILLSSGEIVEIPSNSFIDLREYFETRNTKFEIRNVNSQ